MTDDIAARADRMYRIINACGWNLRVLSDAAMRIRSLYKSLHIHSDAMVHVAEANMHALAAIQELRNRAQAAEAQVEKLRTALKMIRHKWAGHSEACAFFKDRDLKCNCDWPKVAAQCDVALAETGPPKPTTCQASRDGEHCHADDQCPVKDGGNCPLPHWRDVPNELDGEAGRGVWRGEGMPSICPDEEAEEIADRIVEPTAKPAACTTCGGTGEITESVKDDWSSQGLIHIKPCPDCCPGAEGG